VKTKTKLANIKEIGDVARTLFGMQPDAETENTISFTDRNSAGDDHPPVWLIQAFAEKSKALKERFTHVIAHTEVVDEWITVTFTRLAKARVDRPEWDHNKLLKFFQDTVGPELLQYFVKVRGEIKQVDHGHPRVLAFYEDKWDKFHELQFQLEGNPRDGWWVDASFGRHHITHPVKTSRGLYQAVWKKLKAEIGWNLGDVGRIRWVLTARHASGKLCVHFAPKGYGKNPSWSMCLSRELGNFNPDQEHMRDDYQVWIQNYSTKVYRLADKGVAWEDAAKENLTDVRWAYWRPGQIMRLVPLGATLTEAQWKTPGAVSSLVKKWDLATDSGLSD
jgi:hypothetical protein